MSEIRPDAELYVLLRKAGEDRSAAQGLIDRHRAKVLREAADLITSAQERIERDETAEHGFLDHETELQRDAVHYMAKLLRHLADEAVR